MKLQAYGYLWDISNGDEGFVKEMLQTFIQTSSLYLEGLGRWEYLNQTDRAMLIHKILSAVKIIEENTLIDGVKNITATTDSATIYELKSNLLLVIEKIQAELI
ncbi:MAG: hypothetical protein MUE33_01765 [Cytophagaceae bacterium]|jgi:hypothetical protein|nr:hypothetical protein [Cytophagaceae bacterium]